MRNVIRIVPASGSTPVGYVEFREKLANGTNGVRLKAPDSLAATFSITLPTALPGGTECVTLSSAGALATTSCGGGGGGGITSLNGLTNATQTFAIGTSGTAPNFSSVTSTHTLNIPMASTSSVTAGLLSKTDYDTFNAKQGPLSFTSPLVNTAGTVACATCVVVASTPSSNTVPFYTGTGNNLSPTGLDYSVIASNNSLVKRDSLGGISGNLALFQQGSFVATTDIVPLSVRAGGAGIANLTEWINILGLPVSAILPNGDFSKNAATATALAGTPSQCSGGQFALGITATGNANCSTPAGGGSIGGSGTVGQVAEFVTNSTTLTSRPYASTTAGTTSAVLKTGTNKEIFAYDYGAQVYNVAAYGALGNATSTSTGQDDTSFIQAAMTACEDGTGGEVYLPGKGYRISATLHFGNGSSIAFSTKQPCTIRGTGPGDTTSVATNGTTIYWDSGTSPGASTYMLEYRGPYEGGGVSGFTFDTGSKNHVLPLHIVQAQHFKGSGIHMIRTTGGPAVTIGAVKTTGMNGCRQEWDRIMINAPGSGGEGILFDEMVGGGDTCSSRLTTIVAHGSTYGMHLIGADNVVVERAELSGSTCGLKFTQSTVNSAFPHENTFIALSPGSGVCGTVGTGRPNVFIDYKLGDCSSGTCDIFSGITSGTRPIVWNSGNVLLGTPVYPSLQGFGMYQAEVPDNTADRTYFRADVGATNLMTLVRPASSNDVVFTNGASGGGLQFNVPSAISHYTDSNSSANYFGQLYSSSASGDRYGIFTDRARGTKASPSNIADGDRLGTIVARGRTSGSFNVGSRIDTYADGTASGTSMTSSLRIAVSKSGTLADSFKVGYLYVQYLLAVFSDLPACSSTTEGARARITDGSTATWDANVSGGGSSRVFVICNGTNWKVDH